MSDTKIRAEMELGFNDIKVGAELEFGLELKRICLGEHIHLVDFFVDV